MLFADGLFARQMYDLALGEYLGLLDDHPAWKQADGALYRSGDCYRQLGQNMAAERQYARVFKEYASGDYAVKAGIKRADIFIRENRPEEGVELYRQVIRRQPPEPLLSACMYFLGDALMMMGQTNEAEQSFLQIVRSAPGSAYLPYTLIRLAEIGRASGKDTDEILKYYRAASTNEVSQRVSAEALYQIGRMEFSRRNYEESSRAFDLLASRHPEDPRTEDSALESAWAQLSSGQPALAMAAADQVITRGAAAPEWYYLKANGERALQNYEQAIVTYSHILDVGGKNEEIYRYERALCCFALGKYDLALADLGGLQSDKRMREDVLWLMGRSFEESGDGKSALDYFKLLEKEYGKGRFAAQAVYRTGGIFKDRKSWNAAAETYEGLVKAYPEDKLAPLSALAAAICRLNNSEKSQAIANLDQIEKKYPSSGVAAEALLTRAVTELQMRNPREAEAVLKRFMEGYSSHASSGEAWFWLGVIQEESGRHSEAEKSFNLALDLKVSTDIGMKASAYKAVAVYGQGDLKRAAADLQALNSLESRSYAGRNIFAWLTRFRLENDELELASDAARKLLELSAHAVERQEANYLKGVCCERSRRAEEAAESYKAAYDEPGISIYKAKSALALALCEKRQGRMDSAATYFSKAAEMADDDEGISVRARAYIGLAETSEAKNDWHSAARYYMSVAVLFDNAELVPMALASAARCYDRLEKPDDSRKAIEELNERYPESPYAGGKVVR